MPLGSASGGTEHVVVALVPSVARDGRGAGSSGNAVIMLYATPYVPPLSSLGGCKRGPDGLTLVRNITQHTGHKALCPVCGVRSVQAH